MASSSSTKVVAEYTKSGKSSCVKCSEKIDSKSLRLGLKTRDPRGCDSIKWHHFTCLFSSDSAQVYSSETIEGFSELKARDQYMLKQMVSEGVQCSTKRNDQEKLKKLVIEGDQSSKKGEGDDGTESYKRDLKKLKTDEDEKARQAKRNATNEKSNDQEKLKKRVTEGDHSSKKTDVDEKDGQGKKNARDEKIVAGYAKSGKSVCKKCSQKIESKSIRLGLSYWHPRGFQNTKWHHLDCFPLDADLVSLESIEGFLELKSDDQEKLKKLVIEGDQSSKKRARDDETECDRRDMKKLKTDENDKVDQEKENVTNEKIVIGYAKSGKSSCKKCNEKIESKSLRLGLTYWHPRGFQNTKWYHLDCFFSLEAIQVSLESIDGFSELKSNDQEKLKKLVIEGDQSSKKREGDDEIDSNKRDLKRLKIDEGEEAGQENNLTNEKIVVGYAKSSKSSCKKCSQKIESKSIRLGLSYWHPRGFQNTKWHHLNCFFPLDTVLVSPESIEGFSELKSDDQEKLKLVIEGDHSSKKGESDDETKLDNRDLKKPKNDEEEKSRQEKKNEINEKIVVEYAKSGKSSCKKCSEKIDFKSLRLGLSYWHPRGFQNTKWHHLNCFFPLDAVLVSLESIEGFSTLKSDDQEKLKKLVIEGVSICKKSNEDGETGVAGG